MVELAATNPFLRAAVLLLVFGAVMLLAFALITFLARRAAVRRTLRDFSVAGTLPGAGTDSLRETNTSAWARLADAIEKSGLSLSDTRNDELRKRLILAGFRSPSAVRIFTLSRLVLVFLLPGLYALLAYSTRQPPTFLKLYVIGSVLALVGLYLPNLVIQAMADRRRQAIINGFPDCLDLMLVCVESGLGIEASMDRVGREMVQSQPLVAELLSVATLQLRAGSTRDDAFRRMAELAGVDEIRSFTTLLIQSDKLGTSIASTLRVYAEEMRERRRMRAEERAHRLPVLISIPLVVFMLPTMIGVLMLPAAIRVVREVVPFLTG